jgi:hypothetical protein
MCSLSGGRLFLDLTRNSGFVWVLPGGFATWAGGAPRIASDRLRFSLNPNFLLADLFKSFVWREKIILERGRVAISLWNIARGNKSTPAISDN